MSTRFKVFLVGVLAFTAYSTIRNKQRESAARRSTMRALHDQAAQFQVQQSRPQIRYGRPDRQAPPSFSEPKFIPVRNLYSLANRGCEDDDLSSLILQNELIKKDQSLSYYQQDIDDCNDMVLAYVERGVRENSSYYLRRKLVETFGQTNQTVLINRMRLTAVLLGGEKGRGGMDPVFTPIREEAHRISPYVLRLIEDYIDQLETRMTRARIDPSVDEDFKQFVSSLGDSFHSEYKIANIGAENRNKPAEELYALKMLLRDLKEYYGERVVDANGQPLYEVIFSHPGSFTSETYTDLERRHRSMESGELAKCFLRLGLEFREHLSLLRQKRGKSPWSDDEEINHLKKLNEIGATVTGLFAAERQKMDPLSQALTLVDLLYLEGLYSKKDRKALRKELAVRPELGPNHEKQTQAFYRFLNFMHGLAYATMDESLGDATRVFAKITRAAENYLEVEARKSALQVLGQLQLEFYAQHQALLAGKNDIHLAGTAHGQLRVFRSDSEIQSFLRKDSLNGASTLWVLKSGLTMPNEASFAAIIMEDPIMKASHYDGYARSRKPPIPLLQVPGAVDSYAEFHGKHVRLEALRTPSDSIVITETDGKQTYARAMPVRQRLRLDHQDDFHPLIEIEAAKSPQEIQAMQKQVGSKAANYAFLRSALPRDQAKHVEHIFPGFAIPFHFYHQHITSCGAADAIATVTTQSHPNQVRDSLLAIRNHILNASLSDTLLELFREQMEARLRTQHSAEEATVKLRFRSSSNAEDNQDFSGAGLYESHPAYYTYEQEGLRTRDVFASNQHQVTQAIKLVWASLWKPEAYLARERAGIAQQTVRMGILVHPSYRNEESTGVVYYYAPDDIEIAANKGNDNVQNPSIAGLTPEMHRITNGKHRLDYSSRFILSEDKVLSSNDRRKLMTLLDVVVPKFSAVYPDQKISAVDIEFKVLEVSDEKGGKEDIVMLKQIRPLAERVGMN